MPFAALDLHRKMTEAAVCDDQGAVLVRERFPTTREALADFARRRLGPGTVVAVEATFNTWPVVAVLEPLVREVVVSNPHRTRLIAESRVKTDKVDALALATLLRLGYLPRVWQPDAGTRRRRRLCTARAALTADRTRIKNRIHAILHQNLAEPPAGDLFAARGLAWLRLLELDPQSRSELDSHLRHLRLIEDECAAASAGLAREASADPRARLLMTLPGVDFTVAVALLSALGEVSRFPDGDRAASYLGLTPSTSQSGEHCYHGPITKAGKAHARWLLVQAAQHLDRHPGPLGVFFRRLARKKNRNVAVVATARKLVVIAWHMLRHNEPYRYAQPRTAEAKYSRLRILAGKEKRKGGNPKGAPRPAAWGSGRPTRAVPALDGVLAAEGLPAPRPPAPGEEKMLEETGCAEFAAEIRKPKRIPKKRRGGAC